MAGLTHQPPKSLQIKPSVLQCYTPTRARQLWELVSEWGKAAYKEERKTLRDSLRAGAGLLLLRGDIQDGDWADTLAANSNIHRATAWRWMTNVQNLFAHCGIPEQDRGCRALVAETADDDYTQSVLETINGFIDGQNATQMNFVLRAPKKLLLPAARVEEDPAKTISREIRDALANFEAGLAMLQHHANDLDDATRARIGYHCAVHLQHMLPVGWKFHVHAHTGKELTIEQVFVAHLGLPEAGR